MRPYTWVMLATLIIGAAPVVAAESTRIVPLIAVASCGGDRRVAIFADGTLETVNGPESAARVQVESWQLERLKRLAGDACLRDADGPLSFVLPGLQEIWVTINVGSDTYERPVYFQVGKPTSWTSTDGTTSTGDTRAHPRRIEWLVVEMLAAAERSQQWLLRCNSVR